MSLAAPHIDAFAGTVLVPGDQSWEAARQAFNLTVDQRPALIARPVDDADVAAAARFARALGQRVAPPRTGHNAAPLGDLGGTLLLKTDALQGVHFDAPGRRARVHAGATWADVMPHASESGLAALHGSSPDLGVVGYTLGGGVGWYARKYGLACNSVTAVEVVSADGELIRASRDDEPSLFWALRGGGANFGVVTALELQLYPVSHVYAGALFFPWDRSQDVLHAWRELLPSLPNDITSIGRIIQFPPSATVPEPLRGRSFVLIEAVHVGDAADGQELLRPLRELGPELDTFARVPPAAIAGLHMDPRMPVEVVTGGQPLDELDPSAIDALVALTGPGSGSPLLSVELRHLGGALAHTSPHHGALSNLPGSFLLFAVGRPSQRASAAAIASHLAQLMAIFTEQKARPIWNFNDKATEASRFFDQQTYSRLRTIKAQYDADELFHANHHIPPAVWNGTSTRRTLAMSDAILAEPDKPVRGRSSSQAMLVPRRLP